MNEGRFTTTVEAVAAIESALDAIGAGLGLDGSPGEQLELISRLRKAAGRASSMVSVWVAEADRDGAARRGAGTTVTDWLARQTKADPGEARGMLNEGKSLLSSPALKAAATTGRLTPRQLRGIKKTLRELPGDWSRLQRQAAADLLIEKADEMGPGELGRQAEAVTAELAPARLPDAEARLVELEWQRQRAVERRSLILAPDGDGSILIEGSLPVVEGEKLRRLIAAYAASDRAAGDRNTDRRSRVQKDADALVALLNHQGRGDRLPGVAGDRPRVVVTISEADLRARVEQAGILRTGERVDPGVLRLLACDAEALPAVLGGASEVLDVGRSRRTVTPEIRQALSVRDGGCRFPGCDTVDESCEAHHILPWWQGGVTALRNMVLLCPEHHALVEPPRFWSNSASDRWVVGVVDGQPKFSPPRLVNRSHRTTDPPTAAARVG